MKSPNINMFFARTLIDYMVGHDIDYFCVSPGSRSTPLTLAIADHKKARRSVFVDERGSAYHAVGYARATGRAAAVVCTSGTAAANMLPAVIEAHYSRLPIVIITADRPDELQDVGANQTIDQADIFGKFVSASLTLEAPSNQSDPAGLLQEIDNALKAADAAPVHINFRFREPLAPVEETYDFDRMRDAVNRWYGKHDRPETAGQPASSGMASSELAGLINGKKRGLIVAGPEAPFRSQGSIGQLSQKLKWPIAADILSQCRHMSGGYPLSHYDLYLDVEKVAENLRPEIILHIGGLPTSKRLNQFLLECKGVDYIKIQDHERPIDPDHLESHRIICDPDKYINALIAELDDSSEDDYLMKWSDAERRCSDSLSQYFGNDTLSETSLAYRLGNLIADKDALYLSSSMPVRDADTLIQALAKDVITGANRGASGIDGVMASACGFASGSGRPTILLIGDLAFIHDLNSLAVVRNSDVPVIVIVINNDGGGIFHFLPIAWHEDSFEKYFATPHGLSFEKTAEMFGLPYYFPGTMNDFEDCYRNASDSGKSAVIEIKSDREQNIKEHNQVRLRINKLLSE